MRSFELTRYIKKGKYWIILGSILVGILFIAYASSKQTYTASTIIEYFFENASSGLTPNGEVLDVSEIKSTKVIQDAIDDLMLRESVDQIRAGLSITGYVSADETARKTALLERGMDYSYTPTIYIVRYTVGSRYDSNFARNVLDAVISSYTQLFGEKYVSTTTIPNNAAVVDVETYDYLEKADLLNDHITSVLNYLSSKGGSFLNHHTVAAQMSFQDIYNGYEFIQESELPYVYVDILNNRLSIDKNLLIAKYMQNIEDARVKQDFNTNNASGLKDVMNTFADKSKNSIGKASDSTGNSYSYILQDVYNNYNSVTNTFVDRTTTYDYLIQEYANYLINQSDLNIDESHFQTIISKFKSDGSSSVNGEMEQRVNTALKQISARLTSLYDVLIKAVDEYNLVQGSKNLRMRTSITTSESMNIRRLTILVTVAFGLLISVGVIAIGRIGDFVEYTFWIDQMTGLPNRRKCDMFIDETSKRVLPENFFCFMLKVDNIRNINSRLGREKGDQVMAEVGKVLTTTLPEGSSTFYNGNETFISFLEPCDATRAEYLERGIHHRIDEMNKRYSDLNLEMHSAWSESFADRVYDLRTLISETFKKLNAKVKQEKS
ncbi:MAG: diguanylate cyclase [Clostridia bacterium]|nr:diguanylate cyclase [Clostridia bacterium]